VKELNNRTLGEILWEACPDIFKIHQRTNKFGSVIYLEVPSEKEGDIFDVIESKVETVKSTATHLAVNIDEPVTVMSASNYSAPARKKYKMVVHSNFALQSFIRATIPNITSYANVVAGKKEKEPSNEQFPTLTEANAIATSAEINSLTKASTQVEEGKKPSVDELNRKVATLESIVVKTLNKLETMEQLLSTFLVHINNSQCKSVVGPLTLNTTLTIERESQGTMLKDIPTEFTSPNPGPNIDKNSQQSLSMDNGEMKDSITGVQENLPKMIKEASQDIDMPLKPMTGKHPRETINECVPEQNFIMSQTKRKTSGPMEKYVHSQSPLPALNGNVQRGGDQ